MSSDDMDNPKGGGGGGDHLGYYIHHLLTNTGWGKEVRAGTRIRWK